MQHARVPVPGLPVTPADEGLERLLRTAMLGTLFLIGIRTTVGPGVTVGAAASILITPLWLPALRRYRGAWLLLAAAALAVLVGCWLTWIGSIERAYSRSDAVADVATLIGLIASVGVILWSRQVFTTTRIAVTVGLGMLANIVMNPGALTSTNPWKFGYLVPVAVIVLALVGRGRRVAPQLLVSLALALSCVIGDARSYFGSLVLVCVLLAWQGRPRVFTRSRAWGWTVAMFAATAFGVYQFGQALLVRGYLGDDAQARSVEQLRTSGSLILGGRPEMSAAWGLLRDQPQGYGVGVVPGSADIAVARNSMFETLGYLPDSGYVENFMFGGRFELHSTLGDLWAHFGVGGLLLGAVIAFLVIRGAARRVVDRRASALLLFLTCWTLWNLLFSPLYSALPTLILVLGLTLEPDARPARAHDADALS